MHPFTPLSSMMFCTSLVLNSGRTGTAVSPTLVRPRYAIIQVGHDSPISNTLSPFRYPREIRNKPKFLHL